MRSQIRADEEGRPHAAAPSAAPVELVSRPRADFRRLRRRIEQQGETDHQKGLYGFRSYHLEIALYPYARSVTEAGCHPSILLKTLSGQFITVGNKSTRRISCVQLRPAQ